MVKPILPGDSSGADDSSASVSVVSRFARPKLEEALSDTPVVLVHGPRQCGKTTLARAVGEAGGYTYLSFDDDNLRAAAQADPVGFVADLPERVVLDEVQRIPTLFTSIKASVDQDRRPGRFLLTGSANVLLVPQLADSLAGRMEVLRLHPLAQCELARGTSRFLDDLLAARFPRRQSERLGAELIERVLAGGYPEPLTRQPGARRRAWYRAYVDALVQRDVRDIARVNALDALPRLMQAAAAQTANLFNATDLSAPFQLSRPTIRDYITLLERVFLLELLPPWHNNQLSRLIKTPKLHLGDSGLAAALLNLDASVFAKDRSRFGPLLETFVFQELRRLASWHAEPLDFHHYRDKDGVEVDIVIEQGAHAVAGVEVKAASTVIAADFKGLRRLQAACGERFVAGVVLYDGEMSLSFGERLFAVPVRRLWES